MNIHPIRNQRDYKAALKQLSAWFDDEPEPGTEEGDRFEILTLLVEAYEAKRFVIDAPDPIEAIFVDWLAFGHRLSPLQWLGVAAILLAAAGMQQGWSLRRRRLAAA